MMVVIQLQVQLQSHISKFNGFSQHPFVYNLQRSKKLSLQAKAVSSRTQRIMESISVSGEVGGAGGAYSYDALKRLDNLWSTICSDQRVVQEPKKVVSNTPGLFSESDIAEKEVDKFDVLVCGGTLGIFIATALSLKGLRVGVVERNQLKGKGSYHEKRKKRSPPLDQSESNVNTNEVHQDAPDQFPSKAQFMGGHAIKSDLRREQEWNISRKELLELVEVGILTEEEIELTTTSVFNPNRCGFERKGEIWVENILNLGVSPSKLIDIMRERFNSLGGVIFEGCSVSSINVYQDVAVLQLAEGKNLSARLIIDAMGNFSPVLKQIRGGRKPDGICLVVGSCGRGFKENSNSDVIFSSAESKPVGNSQAQYFWEAFPAGSGPLDRTTYMFTYVEPQSSSPKLEELLEDYWDLMPTYQEVALDELEILRVIYGIFPTYRDSPLPAAFNRVLQFGDASGIQSPVSFGGFGSLTRHLGRLTNGIHEAISANLLDADNLSLLNPYMPNLSASWLFQRAMSARKQAGVSPDFINELLYANFQSMQRLGDPVLRPFLQDVIQFGPLVKTLGLVMITKPQILPSIFKQVGFPVLIDWLGHFSLLGSYTFLSIFIDPLIRPMIDTFPTEMKYKWKRQLEAWKYGSGLDYKFESEDTTKEYIEQKPVESKIGAQKTIV